MTVDVSDPDNPTLISGVDTPQAQSGNLRTVTNGPGLALVATGSLGLEVHDASDPDVTYDFITKVDGTALSVAVSEGIAFVAGGDGGMTVVNYLPFDNQGIPPDVAINVTNPSVVASLQDAEVQEAP